jgi:hypothetical protein
MPGRDTRMAMQRIAAVLSCLTEVEQPEPAMPYRGRGV